MEPNCPLSAFRVLTHHGDSSGCYIQDFLVSRDEDVTPYHLEARWSYVKAPEGTFPRFAVVEASIREITTISCRKPVTVIDLVLADGEGTLFRAATGLGLSRIASQVRVDSGMSIVVCQKNIILLNDNPLEPSLFMVIHRMGLREQPNLANQQPKQAKTELELELCDYRKDHFTDPDFFPQDDRFPALTVDCYPNESVKTVMQSGRVVFMSGVDLPPDLQDRRVDFLAIPNVFAEATNSPIENGTWGIDRGEKYSRAWRDLVSYHARPEGRHWYTDRERIHYGNGSISMCPCKSQHGLLACAAFFAQPSSIDEAYLFRAAKHHEHRVVPHDCSSFDCLTTGSQQSLYCWWYSVNFFGTFGVASKLPGCVICQVVRHCPSPSDANIIWLVRQQALFGHSLLANCFHEIARFRSDEEEDHAGQRKRGRANLE